MTSKGDWFEITLKEFLPNNTLRVMSQEMRGQTDPEAK